MMDRRGLATRCRPIVAGLALVTTGALAPAIVPIAVALEIPPAPRSPVYDAAGLLSAGERARLEREIVAFEAGSSNQIAVAIFPSLDGESLEDFTIRLAEKWQPGDRERSNGVILAIFVGDRRVRIEVGYGLEGALTDAVAARIIRNEITPEFRAGRYDDGVRRAVTSIMAATRGEYEGKPRTDTEGPSAIVVLIALLIFFVIVLYARHAQPRHFTGRGVWADAPPGSGRRRGGWLTGGSGRGGGGGRGGFGGFGGGSFGGGGASGGW